MSDWNMCLCDGATSSNNLFYNWEKEEVQCTLNCGEHERMRIKSRTKSPLGCYFKAKTIVDFIDIEKLQEAEKIIFFFTKFHKSILKTHIFNTHKHTHTHSVHIHTDTYVKIHSQKCRRHQRLIFKLQTPSIWRKSNDSWMPELIGKILNIVRILIRAYASNGDYDYHFSIHKRVSHRIIVRCLWHGDNGCLAFEADKFIRIQVRNVLHIAISCVCCETHARCVLETN